MNSYIEGLVIEITENGRWVDAVIKNNKEVSEVIMVEKEIKLKSKDGEIHNIYCNKNIHIESGEYVYLYLKQTLNNTEIKKKYKNKREYKIDCQIDDRKIMPPFILLMVSGMLTLIFQPALKTILTSLMYIDETTSTGNIMSITEKMSETIGPNSPFFSIILYCFIFLMLYSTMKNIFPSLEKTPENKNSIAKKAIGNREATDLNINKTKNNLEEKNNETYKISLTKK